MVEGLLPTIPETQKPPGMGMITGTVKAFLKDELPLPPATKVLGVAVNAGIAGKKLADNIQKALDEGQSPAEAYTCQTVKTVTEEVSAKAIKGAIVRGIPPYLSAATTSPALAITVPVVLPLIPEAYQGAQTFATGLGNSAETLCHKGFGFAKQLTKKGD